MVNKPITKKNLSQDTQLDQTVSNDKTNAFDVVIIGAGPGGLTAAIYASRANLKTLIIEKGTPGGKIVTTSKIENWTGDISVDGPDLAMRMYDHALAFDAKLKQLEAIKIISNSEFDHKILVKNRQGEEYFIQTKAIIIATGMVEKVPEGIENIKKFNGRGVSYCAICEGPLFKNQLVGVIGGGNSAIEEAVYLSSIAKHVYIFVRKPEELWAEQALLSDAKQRKNITIYTSGEIVKLEGKDNLEQVEAKINNKIVTLNIRAVFPYIGHSPGTNFIKDLNITNKHGFIETDEMMMTKIPGIYAIGDVRAKEVRQIATSVSDGVIAGKIIANRIET